MKRIILISLILIALFIGLFVLTGCDSNNEEKNTTNNSSQTTEKITNEFSIGDTVIKFDKEATFKDFSYKNAEGIEPDESQKAVFLEYVNKDIYDGRFVFNIRLAYTDDGTTLEESLKGYTAEKKKINGIDWSIVSIDNTTDNKETTSRVYATEKNGTLYIASIITFKEANVDTDKLAEVFMNGVIL